MDTIFLAVLSVTAIAAVCAFLLCVASRFMYVKVDERIALIEECLPGTNCGACGFPGCGGYAKALADGGDVKCTLCTPGGPETAKQISGILGVETGDVSAKLAFVHCRGDCNAQESKMEYKGIKSCYAAKQVFGGEGACAFGCLGYGDCLAACPENAICMECGLARVDASLCTGCGLCVKACPNNIITIEDASVGCVVLCENTEKGAVVRKKCKAACLGCTKCVRECPSAAITVENFLAKIDYEKCTGCGHCAEICVTKCIQSKLIAAS
jgi:Na+-translocating ferredoxin:NAD+ oxidoreductase RNF subunit RnfB